MSNIGEIKIEMRAKSGSQWPNSVAAYLYNGNDYVMGMDYGESNQQALFDHRINGTTDVFTYPIDAGAWHNFAWTRDNDGWWLLNIDGGPVEDLSFYQNNQLTSFDQVCLNFLRNQSEIEWVKISGSPISTPPDIDVSPMSYDFGEGEVGSSATQTFTISNVGDSDLIIDDLLGLDPPFSITSVPILPATVAPGGSEEVEIAYAPTSETYSIDALEIYSNDPDESPIEVALEDEGVEVPPSETIEEILEFIEDSVEDGTLVGVGRGKSAENRLNALTNILEEAGRLIEDELFEDARPQLLDAYKRTDGQSPPPDFVTGEAASELAEQIHELMISVSGDYAIHLDSLTTLALVVEQPVTISGTVYQYGVPFPDLTFGVHDDIRQMSYMVSTNQQGHFSFTSTPLTPQVAIVEYLFGSRIISTSYDVVDLGGISSPLASAVRIQNTTSSTYSALITSPFGNELVHTILPSETKELIRTTESIFTFHPTKYGGVGTTIGLPLVGGGSISATVDDNGVVTTKLTGGTLVLLRFSVYGTSELDAGICWSPGGEIGFGVGGGFDICYGSDGFSIGGSTTLGFVTSGLNIRINKL